MSNYEILNKIIHSKFLADNQSTLLESKGKEKKPMQMNISCRKSSEKYRLYRFDPDDENIFPFFSREKGLQKICDYIILADKAGELFILLLELKRGKSSSKKQLEASKCFMQYIINTAKRIDESIDDKVINIRTIRICETSILRKTTNMDLNYKNEHLDYTWNKFVISALLH